MEETQQQDYMKPVFIQVSPSISSFLETHGDIALSAFRNAFKEKLYLTVIKSELIHVKGSRNSLDRLKLILMNEPWKLNHSSKEKSWLTKNSESWLTFTNYLTVEYLCAIYTETDFSKSYIFIAPHHNTQVSAKIKDFLPFKENEALPKDKNSEKSSPVSVHQPVVDNLKNNEEIEAPLKDKNSEKSSPVFVYQPFVDYLKNKEEIEALPEDKNSEKSSPVFVYQPFVDYLKNNEGMAPILERGEQSSPDTPLIKIKTSKESFKVLKSRLEMVISQSCLLNASQAKLFTDFGDEILSDIQRNYQVIGNVFQSDSSMNILVLTYQTDLICTVCPSEPDYCPVDNYISLNCSFPHSQTEYTVAKKFPSGDKIWKSETWNLPFNQRLHVELPLMQIDDMKINFKVVLEECFQIIDKNKSFNSKITGIHLPVENLKVLNQFCSDLVDVLQSFDQMHLIDSSYKCITVLVDSPEIQRQITETISELTKGKTEESDEGYTNVALGAIPKNSKRTQQETRRDKPILQRTGQKTHSNKPALKRTESETRRDKPVLLVQFSDFSGNPENLRLAVETLMNNLTEDGENCITTCDAKIHRNKLESILFFFEEKIIEVVPDIKDQLAKSEEEIITIVIPENSQINVRQTFKKLLKKIPKKKVDVQSFQENTSLDSIISECNREFPHVKCKYIEARSNILLESLNLNDLKMAEEKIKSLLDQPLGEENPTPEELPGDVQENFQTDFESGQAYNALSYLTIRVLHNDIRSVDAETIACPVSSSMAEMPAICQLLLNGAGAGVQKQLMAFYDQYPDKILPEGEVICTSAGKLKYKFIFFVHCPKYTDPKYDDYAIQQILHQSICNLLKKAERLQLQSVGFPVLSSAIFNLPLDLCLEASLDGITLFVNQISNTHLKVINFVDNQEDNCRQIMNFFSIYLIPFEHNLESGKPQRQRRTRRQLKEPSMPIPDYEENPLPSLPPSQISRSIPDYEENPLPHLPPSQISRPFPDYEQNPLPSLPPSQISRPFPDYKQNPHLPLSRISSFIPCPVCFKLVTKPKKKFDDCQHEYCSECIAEWQEVIGDICPLCMNMKPQPPGEMVVKLSKTSLPGFEEFGTYKITYYIPDGIQQSIHPNPGKMYHGTLREAYLPASEEGESVLKMLQKAFQGQLVFSIGDSLSSKKSDVVVWNGILHKTNKNGGPLLYGYPDPHYLDYVTAQMIEIGITPESVQFEKIEPKIRTTAFS